MKHLQQPFIHLPARSLVSLLPEELVDAQVMNDVTCPTVSNILKCVGAHCELLAEQTY